MAKSGFGSWGQDHQPLGPEDPPALGPPLKGPHQEEITGVVFSPDGKILASMGFEIVLWDVKTRRALGTLLAEDKTVVYSMAFSPDGQTLATGGENVYASLWDVNAIRPPALPQPEIRARLTAWPAVRMAKF